MKTDRLKYEVGQAVLVDFIQPDKNASTTYEAVIAVVLPSIISDQDGYRAWVPELRHEYWFRWDHVTTIEELFG